MTRIPPSHTETQLLRRIQRRLVGWFLAALIGLDVVVVALTYGALDYHLTSSARQAILTNWHDIASSTVHRLLTHSQDEQQHGTGNQDRPRVATWVIPVKGTGTSGPRYAEGIPIPIAHILPVSAWSSRLPRRTAPLWLDTSFGTTRVLIGALPLRWHGRYLGSLESVYWVGSRDELLGDLLRVDVEIGAAALIIMLAAAYWLSGRSLEPVRKSMARQRAFVHDVSHEIRTPLAILKSSLELGEHEEQADDMRRAITDSLQEVDYLTRLVDDLATLARIDSGVTPLSLQRFSLTALIADVIHRVAPQAEVAGVSLSLESSGPAEIWADPTRIRQLLLILLDNAIKYNRPGGEVRLTVGFTKRGVRMRVADTGPGIAPEDLPHVFDRFYRSRGAGRLTPGSGLGLAIAVWVVRAHHGTISIESCVGSGTALTVNLPHLVGRRPKSTR